MTKILTQRDIITELLRQFKNSPCLWDTTHESYSNRKARKRQYERLLVVYRQMDPNGTLESLKTKLDSYRASYRRERRKVENSIVNGAGPASVYKPTLWYYNLLTFLNANPSKSSDEEEENLQRLAVGKKRRMSFTEHSVESDETDESYRNKMTTPFYIASYADSIARQLKELEDPVRCEAERIISDVMYRARTGTLPKYSPEVVDTFMIPESGPSCYDVSGQVNNKESTDCLVVKDDDKQTEST